MCLVLLVKNGANGCESKKYGVNRAIEQWWLLCVGGRKRGGYFMCIPSRSHVFDSINGEGIGRLRTVENEIFRVWHVSLKSGETHGIDGCLKYGSPLRIRKLWRIQRMESLISQFKIRLTRVTFVCNTYSACWHVWWILCLVLDYPQDTFSDHCWRSHLHIRSSRMRTSICNCLFWSEGAIPANFL